MDLHECYTRQYVDHFISTLQVTSLISYSFKRGIPVWFDNFVKYYYAKKMRIILNIKV